MTTDTPRTDAAAIRCACSTYVVPSEFARELERENAALLLEVQDLELQNNAMRSTSRGKEVAKNKKLERENAALRADRDRLDWLEGEDGQSWTAKWYYRGEEWITRAAIDAARKEKP